MRLRELIDIICMDGCVPDEIEHPTNADYIQILEKCKQLEMRIREQMTEKQEELFEDCMAEFILKSSFEQRAYFAMGMKMGIRIIMDCAEQI